MIIMDIVVSDTNIFIDLMAVALLEPAFELPIRIHTVDYVIYEIKEDYQKEMLNKFIASGKLVVKEFEESELAEVLGMYGSRSNNVSVTDCSVWYYAKTNNYRLLTGDGKLRRSAIADGVQVSGILYITDMLVECGLIDGKDMAEKLNDLLSINGRLPLSAIKERIEKYVEHK